MVPLQRSHSAATHTAPNTPSSCLLIATTEMHRDDIAILAFALYCLSSHALIEFFTASCSARDSHLPLPPFLEWSSSPVFFRATSVQVPKKRNRRSEKSGAHENWCSLVTSKLRDRRDKQLGTLTKKTSFYNNKYSIISVTSIVCYCTHRNCRCSPGPAPIQRLLCRQTLPPVSQPARARAGRSLRRHSTARRQRLALHGARLRCLVRSCQLPSSSPRPLSCPLNSR